MSVTLVRLWARFEWRKGRIQVFLLAWSAHKTESYWVAGGGRRWSAGEK